MQQLTKSSQRREVSKELISKLYFTRTQESYLKKCAIQSNYLTEMSELMSKISKKKFNKIIEEVKQVNNVFKKYLEKKNISRVRIEDVIQFQSILEADNKKLMECTAMSKVEIQLKQVNNDIIKIGFMMILQKLQNDRLNNFVNESKYLQEVISRQNQNLNRLGYEYKGVRNPQQVRNVMEEIRREEKEDGAFKMVGDKIRKETGEIYEVSNYLNSIIMK